MNFFLTFYMKLLLEGMKRRIEVTNHTSLALTVAPIYIEKRQDLVLCDGTRKIN